MECLPEGIRCLLCCKLGLARFVVRCPSRVVHAGLLNVAGDCGQMHWLAQQAVACSQPSAARDALAPLARGFDGVRSCGGLGLGFPSLTSTRTTHRTVQGQHARVTCRSDATAGPHGDFFAYSSRCHLTAATSSHPQSATRLFVTGLLQHPASTPMQLPLRAHATHCGVWPHADGNMAFSRRGAEAPATRGISTTGVLADSVKRKRQTMMKKHKWKKRRKLLRRKSKASQGATK